MPKRILVFCGDQYHPADIILEGLRTAAGDNFAFEPGPNGPIVSIESDVAAVVIAKLNVTSPSDPTPWVDATTDAALAGFVAEGKGLFVIHAGTVGYRESPEVRKMTGGTFLRHPEACEVKYEVTAGHVLTAHPGSFSVHDEHYFVDTDAALDIFLTSRSSHGDQPAGWKTTYGHGHVWVVTAGHFESVWMHEEFQKLLRAGLEEVTRG